MQQVAGTKLQVKPRIEAAENVQVKKKADSGMYAVAAVVITGWVIIVSWIVTVLFMVRFFQWQGEVWK